MRISEILEERIYAYKKGSTPAAEARIAELREEIIPILDEYGLKDNSGNPDVVAGEGQKVQAEYTKKVTAMRKEIREIAAKRTGKLSQKGEDIVPVLEQLKKFEATEEGQKDGAMEKEIKRIIEENKREIEKAKSASKDSMRVQALREEIDKINKEMAEISEEVKKNPSYDAESIRRTTLEVAKYHRQNELRGILVRNPAAANEMPEVSRKLEKANNIISELEEIQGIKKPVEKDSKGNPEQKKRIELDKSTVSEKQPKAIAKDKPAKKEESKRKSIYEDMREQGVKAGELSHDQLLTMREMMQPEETLWDKIKGFVKKILPKGKTEDSLDDIKIMDSRKPRPRIRRKNKLVPTVDDMVWAKERAKEEKEMDKTGLMYQLLSVARRDAISVREAVTLKGKTLCDYNEKNQIPNLPLVTIDNPADVLYEDFNNLYYYSIAARVLEASEMKNVPTEKVDSPRPIDDIFKELHRKYLAEKTNSAAAEFDSKKSKDSKKPDIER